MPQTGTDIRGQMRSSDELRDASGYADRPGDFADVVRILDSELRPGSSRRLTPKAHQAKAAPARDGRGYLPATTHDYLVHSLRDWLTPQARARTQPGPRRAAPGRKCAALGGEAGEPPASRPARWEWANIRFP